MILLRNRALDAVEEMDKPDCDPRLLARTYAQFRLVNRPIARWRTIYRKWLRPAMVPGRPCSLLDVGCGGGDVAFDLVRWAARDGIELAVTAIDPDERALAFSTAHPQAGAVTFRRATSADLVKEAATFDFVVSNHVLHHLGDAELTGLLADSKQLCRRLALHNDIERSPAAYLLFFLGALPFRGSFIRRDGLTSIRRSYTVQELERAAPEGWSARRLAPFRTLLVHQPAGA
ncbi:methyltransferase domain-containing protein [Paenarthrobacter sp. DKR-5]|uniref:class I SAM-dependent methyltransferase n=1 Tax=Paenarthrobacter sp. DKR-5 TaxID=2835535 RepID=UPI001BDC45EE|nr:class I SAM-dependent methyltransferase [Paenarthrobacter sp. DKR-5]MBT1004068.1 methyltransferase domain-containing protein [Paenarthrobacter sp. DKR-5]